MSKTLKIALFVLVPLIVLALVAKQMGWLGTAEGTEVEIAEAKNRTVVESVIASGKIQPEVEVKISAEVSGEIIELPIQEGSRVEQGDLLVKINPDLFLAAVNRAQAALNSAKAALATARAQLIEAERNFERNRKLSESKVISDAEFDASKRAYEVAKLSVESAKYQQQSAQATLQEARDNLQRTTIYAPMAGTISMLNSEIGERVVGTAQMTGTEILRVANLEVMEVLVEVNENDIIRVNQGDTALVEVDAYLGKEFKGVVTEIANSAKVEGMSIDQVTNFEVKVRILKSSYAKLAQELNQNPFRPGMTASLEILTNREKGVLAVPIQAVTTRSDTSSSQTTEQQDGDESFEVVFVVEEGKANLKVVETGIQDDQYIVITKGLKAGEKVIIGPYTQVSKLLDHGDAVLVENDQSEEAVD